MSLDTIEIYSFIGTAGVWENHLCVYDGAALSDFDFSVAVPLWLTAVVFLYIVGDP